MFKRLQKDKTTDGRRVESLWPTELILDHGYCKKAIEFINDAEREIRVCAYAWRWYEESPEDPIQQFNVSLIRAIQRGVTVRVLCERIQEGVILKRYGINVRALNTKRTLHTKAILIDGSTLVIGSHNFTRRAHQDNFEASLATQALEPCLQFETYFDALWNAHGKDITKTFGA